MKSIFFGFRMSLTLSVMSSGFLQPMMSHGRDGRNTKRSSSLTTVMSAFFPSKRLSSNAAVNPPNDPPSTTILAIASSPLNTEVSGQSINYRQKQFVSCLPSVVCSLISKHPYHLVSLGHQIDKRIVADGLDRLVHLAVFQPPQPLVVIKRVNRAGEGAEQLFLCEINPVLQQDKISPAFLRKGQTDRSISRVRCALYHHDHDSLP